jgi:hypothetical protein
MKRLITCTLIALFAASAAVLASPDKDLLVSAEKNAWENI